MLHAHQSVNIGGFPVRIPHSAFPSLPVSYCASDCTGRFCICKHLILYGISYKFAKTVFPHLDVNFIYTINYFFVRCTCTCFGGFQAASFYKIACRKFCFYWYFAHSVTVYFDSLHSASICMCSYVSDSSQDRKVSPSPLRRPKAPDLVFRLTFCAPAKQVSQSELTREDDHYLPCVFSQIIRSV